VSVARPAGGVTDSQGAKNTEADGPRGGVRPREGLWIDPSDAGKKINGCKRQTMADTDGRGLMLRVRVASVQDWDGAIPLLRGSRPLFPFIDRVFADRNHAAEREQELVPHRNRVSLSMAGGVSTPLLRVQSVQAVGHAERAEGERGWVAVAAGRDRVSFRPACREIAFVHCHRAPMAKLYRT
jgi:hypothetical protein